MSARISEAAAVDGEPDAPLEPVERRLDLREPPLELRPALLRDPLVHVDARLRRIERLVEKARPAAAAGVATHHSSRSFGSPSSARFSASLRKSAAPTRRHSASRSSASAGTLSKSTCSRNAGAVEGRQPPRQRRQRLRDQRQHRQPVEGPVRLGIVGVGVVARQPEQHRRHPEGQRHVARRRLLGLVELHVATARSPSASSRARPRAASAARRCAPPGGGSRARRPAAHTGPTPSCPMPVGAPVDDRARRPRRIVEQRLRPGARRVVHVDRIRRRRQRRQAVVIVLRMEALHVQHRHPVRSHVEDVLRRADRVLVGHRPAVAPRHHLHPVRAQHVELARPVPGADRRPPRDSRRPRAAGARRSSPAAPPRSGPGSARASRSITGCDVEPPVDVLHHHRHRRRRLGDDLHAAERRPDCRESRPASASRVARRPGRPAPRPEGDERRRRRGLRLGRPLRRRGKTARPSARS